MSLNWDGNRADSKDREFKLVPNDAGVELWRRYSYRRGGWSKWGRVGQFDDDSAAKAYAEDF